MQRNRIGIQLTSVILFVLAGIVLCSDWVQANDSAVEIAAGGLKLRKEYKVSMEKENLFISPDLVVVEYEFLNTAKGSVSSEIAFPIPPFRFDCQDPSMEDRKFVTFGAWVNGKPITVTKEVRAFVKNREVTADLLWAGIDIERFGDPDCDYIASDKLAHLKPNVRRRLVKVGAVEERRDGDGALAVVPQWEARVVYHWKQIFPPGVPIRIRHQYKPVVGFQQIPARELVERYADACFSEEIKSRLTTQSQQDVEGRMAHWPTIWVDYILATANTWKTPIRDFQLTVRGRNQDTVTFCWDGPVERTGETELRAHKTDFVPKNDFRAYFLMEGQRGATGGGNGDDHK